LSKKLQLTASDGHRLGAYCAEASGPSHGGVVVLHEIFGVNHHIRSVCDRLAAAGFTALAPALFDRQQADFESGYTPEETVRAERMVLRDPDMGQYLKDTAAAIAELKSAGPVSLLGFGVGGSVAFGAATSLDGVASAVCYYGAHIKYFADQTPKSPTLLHFGAKDEDIPLTAVDRIRKLRPDCTIHLYEGAGHGFNCDERASFHQPSATMAWERTIAWLESAHRTR
jgi:carboxymethylenebutenolidase